ncbi:MAG: ornithine carbamoyltransferase [Candidatus Omnitrophica bacterium CG07_land_8_20_14_0_80_42_15]|uniref:Ornithine carbamoyltransferase n=1 Tax=Candidatus Aquitaenariimonas noxiae TaxID=1974741 RepID=A0A2J0KVH8_9BACT|nr:MAG: ornithine carbamoyltransferase [Candidatus Omnitrophica bacterium CG07_land_8_20_14_0_80_42_15]
MLKGKDLISINDLSSQDVSGILSLATKVKKSPELYKDELRGKSLALIFQKPSSRTRVSFEVGMAQLGGHAIYLDETHIKFGSREAVKDIAATLSRYVNCIVARTFLNKDIEELAEHSTIPVINGLSDMFHPCQGLSDIFTITEKFKDPKKIKVVYIGDGNNVLHSLMHGVAKIGLDLTVASPKGYEPKKNIVNEAEKSVKITVLNDPLKAAEGADVIYTDVWVSMGQESERAKRLNAFKMFQIDSRLMSYAKPKCLVMHCLPAHRGEEITDSVIDSPNSIVFDQAENRLHVQKAILMLLLDK